MEYAHFLNQKSHDLSLSGFDPLWIPSFLFPFQQSLVEWAVRKGRGAIFADCGLGKTPMQLVWAENVVRKTNRPVLVLTPLAVARQTIDEAQKFGVSAVRSNGGKITGAQIAVTNYEKLHHFDRDDFAGVICDESSILKSFDGARKTAITDFMKPIPYRLLCTATAAPNDYTELGTSSEALGEMGYTDMLNRFFVDDQNRGVAQRSWGVQSRWRFKGHAETPYWKWVCSWARACRKPSDLGFDDDGFRLPQLIENEHVVETRTLAPGMLFALPAANLQEERQERRRTIPERCEKAAELVGAHAGQSVVWCHLNDEGDRLSRSIAGARQVSGAQSDEEKEEIYEAFRKHQLRKLVIKPKIGAWGLNWQFCSHVVSFASHSYEQYYQAVRRCWRFGQDRDVTVDLIATEGEKGAKENLRRKSAAADRMFAELVHHMTDALGIKRQTNPANRIEVPEWL